MPSVAYWVWCWVPKGSLGVLYALSNKTEYVYTYNSAIPVLGINLWEILAHVHQHMYKIKFIVILFVITENLK